MNKSVVIKVADQDYLIEQLSARTQFHLVSRLRSSNGEVTLMSEEDRNWTYDTCLKAVKQKISGDRGWASIMASNGELMFRILVQDIFVLIQAVIKHNLEDFTSGSGSATAPSSQDQASS